MIDFILDFIRTVYKVIVHQLTGECEISRICSENMHSTKMTSNFSKSLSVSKKLSIYRSIVFNLKPFNTKAALEHVVQVKNLGSNGMRKQICMTNIKHCFEYLRTVNIFIESIEKKIKTKFNSQSHVHASKLKSLWVNLMGVEHRIPEIQDCSHNDLPTSKAEDWSFIGFQSSNPATDFRGMGYLGLLQLEYFACAGNAAARNVLYEVNKFE